MTDARPDTGYQADSGFRDAFARLIGQPPRAADERVLSADWFDGPLGPMLAVADDHALVLLEFVERRRLETELTRLRARAAIVPGRTAPIQQIEGELEEYFAGTRFEFETPVELRGTEFQQRVWRELRRIPPGATRSYLQLASAVGRPTAFRAVAQANGANQLAIIVPCHRVINTSGALGGYGGGLPRKRWLLNHEFSALAPLGRSADAHPVPSLDVG